MKEYTVDGIKFSQDEITAKQYSDIMRLLREGGTIEAAQDNFMALMGENIIEFLDIILTCTDSSVNKKSFMQDHFKLSFIKKVVADFFSFNDLFGLIIEAGQAMEKSVTERLKKA